MAETGSIPNPRRERGEPSTDDTGSLALAAQIVYALERGQSAVVADASARLVVRERRTAVAPALPGEEDTP